MPINTADDGLYAKIIDHIAAIERHLDLNESTTEPLLDDAIKTLDLLLDHKKLHLQCIPLLQDANKRSLSYEERCLVTKLEYQLFKGYELLDQPKQEANSVVSSNLDFSTTEPILNNSVDDNDYLMTHIDKLRWSALTAAVSSKQDLELLEAKEDEVVKQFRQFVDELSFSVGCHTDESYVAKYKLVSKIQSCLEEIKFNNNNELTNAFKNFVWIVFQKTNHSLGYTTAVGKDVQLLINEPRFQCLKELMFPQIAKVTYDDIRRLLCGDNNKKPFRLKNREQTIDYMMQVVSVDPESILLDHTAELLKQLAVN